MIYNSLGFNDCRKGEVHMSRKNHEMRNGKLIQTDKRFSQLKMKQKEKISAWLFEESIVHYEKNGKPPNKKQDLEILWKVYDKIECAEMWLPFYKLEKYYKAKKKAIEKRCLKSLQDNDS